MLVLEHTQISLDCIHIGVVAISGAGIAGAVAVGEERRGVVSDKGEKKHNSRASNPPELTDRPSQGQDTGADHRSNDV